MKKIYKVTIPNELVESIPREELIEYSCKLVKKKIKIDFGAFALDDYVVKFEETKWERNSNNMSHTWSFILKIIENLKTKEELQEIEERLKIGL